MHVYKNILCNWTIENGWKYNCFTNNITTFSVLFLQVDAAMFSVIKCSLGQFCLNINNSNTAVLGCQEKTKDNYHFKISLLKTKWRVDSLK